jgi:signal transduction histidine kinase/CheY-like chemotaxis protein
MTSALQSDSNPSGVRRAPVVAGFVLLVLAGVAAIVGAISTNNAERWAAHSLQVRGAEIRLYLILQAAESGQRGYLLTGDNRYLTPFVQARNGVTAVRATLQTLTRDNPDQQRRLSGLYPLIDAKMAELAHTVALKQAGKTDEALATVKSDVGRLAMVKIGASIADFDRAEQRLLIQRQQWTVELRVALALIAAAAAAIAGALAFMVVMAARRYEGELTQRNVALSSEIANREKVEGQLRQAQKMEALGQLTGGVAHDFNNMLAIIVGNLDILTRRLPADQPRLITLVEGALAGANRATALTRRLLAYSRLQPLDPKSTDVNKSVSDMSQMLRRTLGERVMVETVLGGGVWRAFVDGPQLESALLNLAVNGRDAMPDGGRLTIETSNASLDQAYADENAEVAPGQYVMIAVTDTGAGMTEPVMSRAFDPFFTTKNIGAGTGLGLSQVHGFLKQSKGHVKLYSELGVGTTVKLYLPRDLSGGPVEDAVKPAVEGALDQNHTVLVVEDDDGVRQFAVNALRELGFAVVEADSGQAALQRLAEHPRVSVLLTDVVMPSMDGRRLAEAALATRADLHVLYMTGYTRNAIVHNGVLDAGARLLTKPFTIDELERELRAILRARQ